ncbi:hypothetical protein UFOVP27_80 [uncultured Caudovirales phage]|uniref:Uncharacterized protein n=1 Tax=uncultured Caudovirales phage TaxID=2100421 RepID=A0A6J5KPW2_9CAUD|nr:hypothetical protein UFOVP27_80 [uncultured Caudovirales phage]
MAKFGANRFGSGSKYGEVSAVSVFYSSGITAYVVDYNKINVVWAKFGTDPADGSMTYWKLVKSYSGSLDDPDDATYVFGGAYPATFTTSYQETLSDTIGKEINYSIWIFNGLKWIACGNTYVVNVVNDGTLTKIINWLPRAWLNVNSGGVGDAVGEVDSLDLSAHIKAYALTYDIFRAEANLLALSTDNTYTPSAVTNAKLGNYKFDNETVLGDSYHKSLVGVSDVVYAYKGTETGLAGYITGLTHWPVELLPGINLMNDYNDSSFEESIGNWVASSGTFVSKNYVTEALTLPSSANILFDPTFKPRLVGFGQLTTTATTAVTLQLPSSTADATLYGISVKPNTRYIFTGQVLHRDANGANIAATISWYNAFNILLSTTTAPTATATATTWKEFTSISDSGRNGIVSPPNAAFAKVVITVTPASATSSRFAFDLFQFSEYKNSFEFQDAKKILLASSGDKENYVANPSFETGLHSWSSYNGTLATNTTNNLGLTFRAVSSPEISSAVLTATGAGAAYVSDWIPIDPGVTVTASAYVMGSAARFASIKVEYSTQINESLQASIVNDPTYGQHYPTTINSSVSSFKISSITNVVGDGTTITYTTAAAHGFIAGQVVDIVDLYPTDFNLANATIATASGSSFTVTNGTYGTYSYGGSATVQSATLSTTSASQISVTSITPPVGKDAGEPLVKITVYFPNSVANDVFYLDGVMIEESTTATQFFCGGGGLIPTNPVTTQFYSVDHTRWEIKNKFNFVSNPSFEAGTVGALPTDWTGTGLTKVATDAGLNPLYNSNFGKFTYTGGGQFTGIAYLPYAAVGGEDFTISAYVRGATASYQIAGGSQFIVSAANSSNWIRIHGTVQLAAGATSVSFIVQVANTSGSTSTYCHIDGVQGEYGRRVSKFVDPLDAATTTLTNPITAGKTYIAVQSENTGGGKSTWLYNYSTKISRLTSSLTNYVPNGSSWAIKTGHPTDEYVDLAASIIPANSFETSLGGWTGTNSTLSRIVASGSLLGDVVTSGQAYCKVTTAGSAGNIPFKIVSEKVYMNPDGGYYASAAIRPSNANSTGSYTLEVQFYDSNNTVMPVYTDNITAQYTSSKYDGSGILNTVVSTSAARTVTRTITALDRWSYISKTFSVGSIQGAAYAILTVTASPATFVAGQAFGIDRVVFRQ